MEIHNGDSYNDNLLPCPFCGEKPIWYLKGNAEAVGKKRVIAIKCPMCGTTQETAVLKLSTEKGCLMAETKWNMRVRDEKAVGGRYMKAYSKVYVESWPLDIDPDSVKAVDEVRLIVIPKDK